MNFKNSILPNEESRWTAFLNGEPDIADVSKPEADEMEDYTAAWEAAGTSFSYSSANPNQAWLTIQKEIAKSDKSQKFKLFKFRVLKYAAMIVVVMGVGFAAYQVVRTPEKQVEVSVRMAFAETEAHPVNFTVITLPDGSIVKMNASTRIEYPQSFSANARKVKLSGEAFFQVTRDTLHPFIIETSNASVEVLGTSFNVSAYPSARLVEVNVESGKVKLTQKDKEKSDLKSTILPAGKRGWLRIANGEMGQAVIISPNYSSWITKEISFQRTPLSEAFSVLENTYHVRIKMENADIGRIPYTANFADLKLEYIIEVIARTHKLKVKKEGDEIVFARILNKEQIEK
jgi:transmembrane sensor